MSMDRRVISWWKWQWFISRLAIEGYCSTVINSIRWVHKNIRKWSIDSINEHQNPEVLERAEFTTFFNFISVSQIKYPLTQTHSPHCFDKASRRKYSAIISSLLVLIFKNTRLTQKNVEEHSLCICPV